MNFETMNLQKQDTVAVLTISRPQALNALSRQVLQELDAALEQIEKDTSVKALVITGAGEKAFVAGADIKEISELNESTANEFAQLGQNVFLKIERCRVPVIAAVNGYALGGGLELALACDFIYASSNAVLGLPETTLGLMPGFGGTVRLSRIAGLSVAREMIFSGLSISAEEALQKKLINKVVPQPSLLEEVMKVALQISKRAPLAVASAKKSTFESYDLSILQAMQHEASIFAKLFSTEDVKEGTQAFLEKRKAQFKGK
jgi:enoyl-CoA hydratase